jgi:hypothetical protein
MIDGLARTATIPELIWTFCGIVPSLITSYGLWYWIRHIHHDMRRRYSGPADPALHHGEDRVEYG